MSFTTRSEYGLRAMVLLAEQFGDEVISAARIASQEAVPPKYLEHILRDLKKAGLVQSRPGARGGYRLAHPSREITVYDVILAVDGTPALRPCADDQTPSRSQGPGRLRPLWQKLDAAMLTVLQSTTLDQLAFSPQLLGEVADTDQERDGAELPERGMFHI